MELCITHGSGFIVKGMAVCSCYRSAQMLLCSLSMVGLSLMPNTCLNGLPFRHPLPHLRELCLSVLPLCLFKMIGSISYRSILSPSHSSISTHLYSARQYLRPCNPAANVTPTNQQHLCVLAMLLTCPSPSLRHFLEIQDTQTPL
jgi:hypothetical protein